jgi:hypothetical protein
MKEHMEISLPASMVGRLKALSLKWYPNESEQRAMDRTLNRMFNLGLRRLQENPEEMAAFLRGEMPHAD